MTSTTFFITFIPILSIILLIVNLVLAPHNPYQEKDSAFECGFHSFLGQNRTQFNISFFIFGLLFLLFDLEILLVYPYSVSSYSNDIYGLAIMMVFFILLTLGFIFELGKNALTIDSKQIFIFRNKDKSNLQTFTKLTINSMIISTIRRKTILAEIRGLQEDLKLIRKAERLDSILVDKSKNNEMLQVVNHFSSFFDEDSGNTREEGIIQVKKYLKEEIAKNKSQIGEGSSKSTEDNTPTSTPRSESPKPDKSYFAPVIGVGTAPSIFFYLRSLFAIIIPYLRSLFGIMIPLIGMVPLLCTLLNLEIDWSFYIGDILYDYLSKKRNCILSYIKYEVIIDGFMFVISSISFIRKYIKITKLLITVKIFIVKNGYINIIVYTGVVIGVLLFTWINCENTCNYVLCDAPRAWGLYFQNSASPQMEALVELHDNIMYYLVGILFSVGWIQGAIIRNFKSSRSSISNKYLNYGTLIELIWTITPALILVLIAFPSFKLLYLIDEFSDPSLSILA